MAILGRINKGVANLANWLGLGSLFGGGAVLTALFTWAASAWEPIAAQGWGGVVFVGAGAACGVGLVLSLGLVSWRFFKPLPPAPVPTESKYTLGLAGGDRYIDGGFGAVMSAYEERMTRQLEERARQIKTELAPQDHAEEIRKLESDVGNAAIRVSGIFDDLKSARSDLRYVLQTIALQSTLSIFEALIASAPPPEEREPTAEFHAKAQAYLEGLALTDIGQRQAIQMALASAKYDAEKLLKISQLPDLKGAALLDYRECTISVHQVARVVAVLEKMKAGGEEEFRNARAEIFARLRPGA